jgi:hypothetical protein
MINRDLGFTIYLAIVNFVHCNLLLFSWHSPSVFSPKWNWIIYLTWQIVNPLRTKAHYLTIGEWFHITRKTFQMAQYFTSTTPFTFILHNGNEESEIWCYLNLPYNQKMNHKPIPYKRLYSLTYLIWWPSWTPIKMDKLSS